MPAFVTSSPCSQQVLFFFLLLLLFSFFCFVFIYRRTQKWLPREDLEAVGALLLEERLGRRDFFWGEAASSHLFAFRPPRPPPAQPLCTSGGARSPSIESSGGILLGSGEERGGGPRPRPGSCLDLTPAVGNAGVHFRVGLLQIYILKYQI